MSMPSTKESIEVITSVQRRRHWTANEKAHIVHETYQPGTSVSAVARRHGVAPNQVFQWRRLAAQGALSAVAANEEVVSVSEYRALQQHTRELQRLLGKKTMENEILHDALDLAREKNSSCARPCCRQRILNERGSTNAWSFPFQPDYARRNLASGTSPNAGRRTAQRAGSRDQGVAQLWLSACLRDGSTPIPSTRPAPAESQAYLPRDAGASDAAAALHRRDRRTSPRRKDRPR